MLIKNVKSLVGKGFRQPVTIIQQRVPLLLLNNGKQSVGCFHNAGIGDNGEF